MKYTFPANIKGNEQDRDGFAVKFPDLKGANTGGFTFKEAIIMAEDCLVVSLASYIQCHEELPTPSPWSKGQELFTVQPLIAAQLDLYVAMREQGVTATDLAQRLGQPESHVHRLLSLDYKSSLNEVAEALDAVGCRLAVEELAA